MAGSNTAHDVQSSQESLSKSTEEQKDMATPDMHNAGMRIERAREAYRGYTALEEKPSKGEIWAWYLYELCSYSIITTLLPIVFPLIISKVRFPQELDRGWGKNSKGLVCDIKETELYDRLTNLSISINNINLSVLEWTSISWFIGLMLASPFVALISTHLDHGHKQQLIAAAATAIGSLFCLPVGFFKTVWIFPLYIAPIVVAYIVAAASHTRHLGLVVRGFTGPILQTSEFPLRRGVSGRFSLYATAAGGLGSAIMSAFTFHMLESKEIVNSLWVVSIFSGLIWLVGMSHVISIRPGAAPTFAVPKAYFLKLFNYPHALGSLVVIFISSFTSMCIFTGGTLYLVGHLCLKPIFVLYFLLVYFISPSLSLPLLQPLQHVIKADAVKMQLLGFLLAILTSAVGFYFRDHNWKKQHILLFAAIQSTSTGLLHAFGRVLLLDCSPSAKEGAFSMWFSWIKVVGTCTGFAVASAVPGNITVCFKVTFCTAIIGKLVLIFGNIHDLGGAKAAGLLHDDSERGSPVPGLDTSIVIKETVHDQEDQVKQ